MQPLSLTRNFMKFPCVFATILLLSFTRVMAQLPDSRDAGLFKQGAVILFQGDSITDGNRGRSLDPNHIYGHGYVFLIASYLNANFPDREWTFVNRGVGGDTVKKLAARWDTDTIEIQPDVLSIMIGTNCWQFGISPEEFEAEYDQLLRVTREKLPNVKLILMEHFLCGVPLGAARTSTHRQITRKLAEKYDAVFVPLQGPLDEITAQGNDQKRWCWDGVHPTAAGHWIIFDQWLGAVRKAYLTDSQ